MSKDLPSVFKSTTDKKIENNKRVFYSKYESIGNVEERNNMSSGKKEVDFDNANTFGDALNNLFQNNQFVFNVPVEIITNNETVNTKIVSKVGDHLLTTTGKVIQLADILSIKIKEM